MLTRTAASSRFDWGKTLSPLSTFKHERKHERRFSGPNTFRPRFEALEDRCLLSADPLRSIVTVAPASIASGGTATIILTANDAAGNQETSGGSTFSFGLG